MVGVSGDLFSQLAIIIIITACAAFILRLLRQPNILAYVLVGVIIGPIFHLVTDLSIIESMSLIGVAFLLFLVGLEMDLKSLRHVALVSSFGGIIQISILFIIGYVTALILGFLSLEAAYIGLMISFSSTMVVLKLLSDKRELNTLHGRIATGILLTEDIIAIFALSVMTSINGFSLSLLGVALFKFTALFFIAYLASKFIFPRLFQFAAKNQELLLICSLAVCFLFSLLFEYLGFSIAIGAFIAGVTLGNLTYHHEIIGKIKNLKDFFSMLFFVSLGMGISLAVIKEWWIAILVLLIIILIIKPIITTTICCLFKFTTKPSFLTANSLSQMGEFSLILAAQGLALGHISSDLLSIIVIIMVITVTVTSYNIEYSNSLYRIFKKPLRIFERVSVKSLEHGASEDKPTIVLCGHNRLGYSILRDLKDTKKDVLVIDYNPEIITHIANQGYHCIYGEATDEEIIERMNFSGLTLFISTIPEVHDNILLIQKLRAVNRKVSILVTASDIEEALKLYKHGADYVILPHFLGGEHVSTMVTNLRHNRIDLKREKIDHLKHLKERRKMGHEHPK